MTCWNGFATKHPQFSGADENNDLKNRVLEEGNAQKLLLPCYMVLLASWICHLFAIIVEVLTLTP
jgi:hypothetical protein